ncbi:DUF2793 domain-containing protein [Bradyrhizobium liaoningense]
MTFSHEAVTALPSGANADAAAIRSMCERRFAYVLDTTESAANFVAVDPVSGTLPLYLIQSGILFQYDSTDSTTVADGVTCLVTNEGKRYKTNGVAAPYAVLSRSTSAQPGSPSVGDTYIVPTAATGAAWSGQDGKIAIYTARGWQFAVSPIGREIYVRDVDAYYHRNDSGVWTAGVGSVALQVNSVTLQNVLGANASFVIKVENQTTNAPPVSPSPPTAYIIGPSPTGSWAGNAGKLAMCLTAGTWTIITPATGDTVYDKAQANSYRFDGSAWISSTGVWVGRASVFSAGGAVSSPGGNSNGYVYSATVAPTSAQRRSLDTATALTYATKKAGAVLRFQYTGDCLLGSGTSGITVNNRPVVLALFRDSEVNAVAWKVVGIAVELVFASIAAMNTTLNDSFEITAADTASHTYAVAIMSGGYNVNGQSLDNTNLTRRTLSVQEAA